MSRLFRFLPSFLTSPSSWPLLRTDAEECAARDSDDSDVHHNSVPPWSQRRSCEVNPSVAIQRLCIRYYIGISFSFSYLLHRGHELLSLWKAYCKSNSERPLHVPACVMSVKICFFFCVLASSSTKETNWRCYFRQFKDILKKQIWGYASFSCFAVHFLLTLLNFFCLLSKSEYSWWLYELWSRRRPKQSQKCHH